MLGVFLSSFILMAYPTHLYACIATAPNTPTTTTMIPETTTVVETSCTSCVAADIDFLEADGSAGSIDSSFREETVDPVTGCARLTAICTAQAGFFSLMTFNINQGGPEENILLATVVEAALNCRDGVWYYRNERAISAVSCQEAING